ncbi:MAG TPA: hypothetical protein VGK29_05140 [Paludibaculum sp.]
MRTGKARGLIEHLLTWFGRFPFRCHDCGARFHDVPIGLSAIIYAKCPRCLRMDLTVWDPKYYRTSRWQDLQLALGGHHWRCEPCRCNFVSVRTRRERYRRPGALVESGSSESTKPSGA